jgi:gliding motility-associated-like protein
MYKWLLMIWALSCLLFTDAKAQNTSNKGKEFWIAYTGHIDQTDSKMYLYITSDVSTTAEVRIGNVLVAGSPFPITANQISAIPISADDAYIGSSDKIDPGRAIQVIAAQPVVVYAHIFKAARSAATLVLPVKVLGREYFVASYTQNRNPGNNPGPAYSEFTIVAVEDNTIIQITPKARDRDGIHTAGITFQKTLQKGDIYQYQSETDLSGTHILSIADGEGICKPIAVFSGSSWVGFCSETVSSTNGGDNLYQQLYPITSWGKEFITAPLIHKPYDIFRVYFSKDNTLLTINGLETGPFNKGTFKEFTSTAGNSIKASEPISVVQYQISQGCDPENGNLNGAPAPHPGDPEMTVLNPVEQTLSKITVYSARRNQTNPPTNITQHYINIIIKDEFKASFTINGLAPEGRFTTIDNTGYSYLQEDVTQRSLTEPTHTLMADGGFSAIAYGYGNVESYGYLAGADAKNLYENLQIFDASSHLQRTDVCVGETAGFTLFLPYQPLRLTWTVDGIDETSIDHPDADGVDVINGVTVYKYNYRSAISFDEPRAHQIKATAINPTPSGCDPKQEILVDFEAFAIPESKFSPSTRQSCAGSAVTFTDESTPNGNNLIKWYWDFGDGTGLVEKRSAAPFEYIYANAGNFTVTHWVESEAGCSSPVTDPITIKVSEIPEAKFKFSSPSCETRPISFTDESVPHEGTIEKWHWDFGDVSATSSNSNVSIDQHPVHTFSAPGTYAVTLTVETSTGCTAVLKKDIIINPLPVSRFDIPDACVADAAVKFNNTAVNTLTDLACVWDFGDPASGTNNNTSTAKDGIHKYTAAREYTVKLTVSTPEGCSVTTAQTFRVNGATPVAAFQVLTNGNLCSNKEILVKDNSSIAGFDNITRLQWFFDNVMVAEQQHPAKNETYALNYPEVFSSPLTKPVTLKLIAYSGDVNGPCKNEWVENITLHAAPLVSFAALAPICLNAGTVKIEASDSEEVPGTGVFSGTGISASGFFDPAMAGLGTHPITYTFTADNGCIDIKTQNITVQPLPVVNMASDIYAYEGGTIAIKATVSEPGLQYKWTPATGLSRDDVLNPVITAGEDKSYTLTATSTLNCAQTFKVNLHVLKNISPANAFSPNGDGVNDVWVLKYIETYPNVTVDVFNRYGEKVFFSQGYSIPFDGNYKGKALPVGTYYYMIDPKNGRKTITGALTLIR